MPTAETADTRAGLPWMPSRASPHGDEMKRSRVGCADSVTLDAISSPSRLCRPVHAGLPALPLPTVNMARRGKQAGTWPDMNSTPMAVDNAPSRQVQEQIRAQSPPSPLPFLSPADGCNHTPASFVHRTYKATATDRPVMEPNEPTPQASAEMGDRKSVV